MAEAHLREDEYLKIAESCDRLLRRCESAPECVAIPWLHVLNQHPLQTINYLGLVDTSQPGPGKSGLYTKAYKTAAFARNIFRAFPVSLGKAAAGGPLPGDGSGRVDVVMVSWLVSVDHLDDESDFYFGNVQQILADQGFSSLLVLRNQTGRPTAELAASVRRGGSRSRMMLPEALGVREEFGLLRQCYKGRGRLRRLEAEADLPLDRRVAHRALEPAVSHATAANLRVRAQIASICRRMKPSVVMALYEGHAWERSVFSGAKSADPKIVCAGYQHTIIQKYAHAINRAIGPTRAYDPDLILSVGEVTRKILKAHQGGHRAEVIAFGTHRRRRGAGGASGPSGARDVLVLPEGIDSESVYLFNFALECARRLPDVRFIFRTHPVLPFEKIKGTLNYEPAPANVEISAGRSIDDDFARSGYLLYRGSSTVIYAILAGLRPYYISKPEEIDIDPIFELTEWRQSLTTVDDLLAAHARDQSASDGDIASWRRARDYCDQYVQPERAEAIAEMMGRAIELRRKICLTQEIS